MIRLTKTSLSSSSLGFPPPRTMRTREHTAGSPNRNAAAAVLSRDGRLSLRRCQEIVENIVGGGQLKIRGLLKKQLSPPKGGPASSLEARQQPPSQLRPPPSSPWAELSLWPSLVLEFLEDREGWEILGYLERCCRALNLKINHCFPEEGAHRHDSPEGTDTASEGTIGERGTARRGGEGAGAWERPSGEEIYDGVRMCGGHHVKMLYDDVTDISKPETISTQVFTFTYQSAKVPDKCTNPD